jgi:hypothetical protein
MFAQRPEFFADPSAFALILDARDPLHSVAQFWMVASGESKSIGTVARAA